MLANLQLQHEFYDRLLDSQFALPHKRQDTQRKNLAKLLRHARAHVPFYAGRLEAVFTPSGDIDWDRWRELPILKRDDLLDHHDVMQSQALPAIQGGAASSSTSGSSGRPVTVSSSAYSRIVQTASVFRAQGWHGFDWSRNLVTWGGMDVISPSEIGRPAQDARWGPAWLPASTGSAVYASGPAGARNVLDAITTQNAFYLGTRPQRARQLADEAMRLGLELRLGAILGFGTATTDEARVECEAAFGARIVSPYSSKEGHLMAFQCPTGTHYHVNEETALVEIVDDDGDPCAPGVTGRVVVTSIHNFAQPIIRYDQGDLAIPGVPCGCGRTLRVIQTIVGRQTDMFQFPGGIRISPNLPRNFSETIGAKYWQVAQTGPLALEVRYVPDVARADDLSVAVSVIRSHIHPDVRVTFSASLDPSRNPGGKFTQFVYEVTRPS